MAKSDSKNTACQSFDLQQLPLTNQAKDALQNSKLVSLRSPASKISMQHFSHPRECVPTNSAPVRLAMSGGPTSCSMAGEPLMLPCTCHHCSADSPDHLHNSISSHDCAAACHAATGSYCTPRMQSWMLLLPRSPPPASAGPLPLPPPLRDRHCSAEEDATPSDCAVRATAAATASATSLQMHVRVMPGERGRILSRSSSDSQH